MQLPQQSCCMQFFCSAPTASSFALTTADMSQLKEQEEEIQHVGATKLLSRAPDFAALHLPGVGPPHASDNGAVPSVEERSADARFAALIDVSSRAEPLSCCGDAACKASLPSHPLCFSCRGACRVTPATPAPCVTNLELILLAGNLILLVDQYCCQLDSIRCASCNSTGSDP